MLAGMLSSLRGGQGPEAKDGDDGEAEAGGGLAGHAAGPRELQDFGYEVGAPQGPSAPSTPSAGGRKAWSWNRGGLKVPRAAPAVYDVENLGELPGFLAALRIGQHLAQKGFCLIGGSIPREVRVRAVLKAVELKKSGAFWQPPQEVLDGFLGSRGSAWLLLLRRPSEEQAGGVQEAGLEALLEVDQRLAELGRDLAGCTEASFGMRVLGRSQARLHCSRHPGDGEANPPLIDTAEAEDYMALFHQRKLRAVYYAGPSPAVLVVTPTWDEGQEAYRAQIDPGTLVVVRAEVCRCTLEPRTLEPGFSFEVEFYAEGEDRELLRLPEALEEWLESRLQAIVENDVTENVPEHWQKTARQRFYKNRPLRILEAAHGLPTTTAASGSWRCPFEGTAMGGNDCIVEIPMSKWDIGVYYDDDPMSVDDFKMYTRHMGVLDRAPDVPEDFFLSGPGPEGEAKAMDPRQLLLRSSASECLHLAGLGREDTDGEPVGVFCGLSGNEMYYQVLSREMRLSKADCAGMGNAASANRLSFALGSTGPSLAVDTEDSSGASAMDTAVSYIREDRCDLALVGGVSFVQHPFTMVVLCASGTVSRNGRGRVFDELCDGFVRGEGVVTVALEVHGWRRRRRHRGGGLQEADVFDADGARGEAEDGSEAERPFRALVMGSALNSKGTSSSLTAPSAPAILDVLRRALQDAACPGSIVDGVEASAGGAALADALELAAVRRALASAEETPPAVALRSLKSCIGEVGAPGGLAGVARALLLLEKALHGPSLHLRQLFALAEACAEDEDDREGPACGRLQLPAELLASREQTQTVGVSSFGGSGTSVHHVLWGTQPPEIAEPAAGQPIHWFPGATAGPGDAREAASAQADYYIVGTWTGWERPCKMEVESPGVYAYTVTLGENCWENFQIWVNGDKDQVLHPNGQLAERDTEVRGPSPSKVCGRWLAWQIDGRSRKVRLINERMHEELGRADEAPPNCELDLVVAFPGDERPPGHEGAADFSGMPILETNAELLGVPGDRYTARLHVRGKYRRVEWAKLAAQAKRSGTPEDYRHCYYVVGDHNFWTFSEMQEEAPGVYAAEVQLLRGRRSGFQVVRDRDWDQTFYPEADEAEGGSSASEAVAVEGGALLGPDGLGLGRAWALRGEAGDVFRVEFQRKVAADGSDTRRLSWALAGSAPLDMEAIARDHKYYLVGSWSQFTQLVEMAFDEALGGFAAEVAVGTSGRESFQILLNGNWLSAVHPNSNGASFRDEGHQVEGPDDGGGRCHWTMGRREDEGLRAGDRARIVLEMAGGLPRGIRWERAAAAAETMEDGSAVRVP